MRDLMKRVVGVGADVGVVVIAAVDDLGVLLPVVRVHDHVHAPKLAIGGAVHHAAPGLRSVGGRASRRRDV